MTMMVPYPAHAQTLTVLHTFTSGADGATPLGSVSLDNAGNVYGTTSAGGYFGSTCPTGCGTVFRLARRGSGWIFTPLYAFTGDGYGNADGATPYAGVTVRPNGSLYGTTMLGGYQSQGTVYNLKPPARAVDNALGGWTETLLYRFSGLSDGGNPAYGSVIFDPSGSMLGTTYNGGSDCDGYWCGAIFKLTPAPIGWTETAYAFVGRGGGANPLSGVTRDAAGNLYGATTYNGFWNPIVYKLTSGGTWNALYTFTPADVPQGGVVLDGAGNLFGTTWGNGAASTVYELSPANGAWTYSLITNFGGSLNPGPQNGVIQDAAGNLYTTTCDDGLRGSGSVVKFVPSPGGWTQIDLHDFGGGADGSCPIGGLALDRNGNLYGTTSRGGAYHAGVVWELTP
jgi:uncharacterized repeat protein (TIGR03803 family)